MKIINAGFEIMQEINGMDILRHIERVARTCYKSEDKITQDSAANMVRLLIKRGHEAMLEHYSITVKFIVDRGVSHEIVRHRLASFAQESTRYCNYGKTGDITFIAPIFFKGIDFADERFQYEDPLDPLEGKEAQFAHWCFMCACAEKNYLGMLNDGAKPEEARSVLPNSLKTELCMTANLREWRHFFKLRACDATGKAHPQMKEVAIPLLKEFQTLIPVIFDDLIPAES